MNEEVFISYSRKDRAKVSSLISTLRSSGATVWVDESAIDGATLWSQEIVGAIRKCKVFLLALSSNSGLSENVVKEVALASESGKKPWLNSSDLRRQSLWWCVHRMVPLSRWRNSS